MYIGSSPFFSLAEVEPLESDGQRGIERRETGRGAEQERKLLGGWRGGGAITESVYVSFAFSLFDSF